MAFLSQRLMFWSVSFSMLFMAVGCGDSADNDGVSPDGNPAADSLNAVDAMIIDVVAPHDYDAMADSLVVESVLQNTQLDWVDGCVTDLGIDPTDRGWSPPSVEEVSVNVDTASFPDLDTLARVGVVLPVDDIPDDEIATEDYDPAAIQYSSEELDASEECMMQDGYEEASYPFYLYMDVIVAWYDVLETIDELPDVQETLGDFSQCVRDSGVIEEGVPPEAADSPGSFLAVMDGVAVNLGQDGGFEVMEEIYREGGQLFAECMEGVEEARAPHRSGPLRDEFLEDNEDDIVELSEILYGEGIIDETD